MQPKPTAGLTCAAFGIAVPDGSGELERHSGPCGVYYLCRGARLCCARIRLLAQQEQEQGELPPLMEEGAGERIPF